MDRETGTLVLLGVAHSLNHSIFLVLPPLLSDISVDLGASYSVMGLITTITFMIYGLGALFGGPLSDIVGSVKVAQISIGLAGLMTFFFLVSSNVMIFSGAMFLTALWASFYHPTSNNLIARAFPSNIGGAMGLHGAAGTLGQVITPTLAFMLGALFDWRYSFVFFGLLSVITALMMTRIKINETEISPSLTSFKVFFKIPNIWLILFFNVLIGWVFRGVELFFPSLLSIERNYSGGIAAILNSSILLLGVAGQLIGGKASDAYSSGKVLIYACLGVVLGMIFLLVIPNNFVSVILFIVFYGVSIFGHQPAMTRLISIITPNEIFGMAYGVMFFSTFGIGAISTTVTGYLMDKYSLQTAFWLNTIFAIGTLVSAIIIHLRTKENQ
jgi:MFS family permease